jgi:DNA-binding beta-propeller fold protein YncE
MRRTIVCLIAIFLLLPFLYGGCGGDGGSKLEPFNTSCFPLEIPGTDGGWCNFAFDADGNLILPDNVTNEILSVDRLSCVLSTLATVSAGGQLYSIVYHPGMDTIYVGDDAWNIYAVNPSSGASTLFVNLGNYPNALVVAPEGYGPFGGQLLAATTAGVLVAVDTASAAMTDVADTGGTLSDLEFTSEGTLYAVNDDSGEIITISSEGMTSVFASGFLALDGIAVDNTEGRLLVADSDADILYGVDLAGGARTNLGSFDFDSGYYPSGA